MFQEYLVSGGTVRGEVDTTFDLTCDGFGMVDFGL
jgi:hypothetical protein